MMVNLWRSDHAGDLRDAVLGFHKAGNLVSFSLAEVFGGNKQLRLPSKKALNTKHPQPPKLQLIKVALRTSIRLVISVNF